MIKVISFLFFYLDAFLGIRYNKLTPVIDHWCFLCQLRFTL